MKSTELDLYTDYLLSVLGCDGDGFVCRWWMGR